MNPSPNEPWAAAQDSDERAMIARWARELEVDQKITCDLHRYGFEAYTWALARAGDLIEVLETNHAGFVAIADWLDEQEEAGRILAVACGTYVHPSCLAGLAA
jgi:hypothetical protein